MQQRNGRPASRRVGQLYPGARAPPTGISRLDRGGGGPSWREASRPPREGPVKGAVSGGSLVVYRRGSPPLGPPKERSRLIPKRHSSHRGRRTCQQHGQSTRVLELPRVRHSAESESEAVCRSGLSAHPTWHSAAAVRAASGRHRRPRRKQAISCNTVLGGSPFVVRVLMGVWPLPMVRPRSPRFPLRHVPLPQ